MYKVVVVDDEPIIVKGLTKLVPWEKYGCKVVSTAGDGMEGIQVIREYRPDIIFSDIYMPKMNGLLMAAALKSEFEDTELTILTGYRDFDLAQEAIRLGVTRFILKPSNMEELEEALLVMVQNLQRRGITGEEDTVTGETKAAEGSFLVNKALEYMRKNYRQKVTLTPALRVSDVAEQVGFTDVAHFSRVFKKITGISANEYRNHLK